MKYHYQILNHLNEVVHESKKGIAKKGFDTAMAADEDGQLIMDMKFPTGAFYVRVFGELEDTAKN